MTTGFASGLQSARGIASASGESKGAETTLTWGSQRR